MQKLSRRTTKSGKEDPNLNWSQCRLAQCKQYLEQLAYGDLVESGTPPIQPRFSHLQLHGIVWWDEHHKKCILGKSSARENLICRDENGEISTPEKGGVFKERQHVTSVKYPKEGRGCFGVAMRKVVSGEFEGVKCLPFDYTGKTVVGPTKFNTLIRLEQARVVPLKGIWSAGQG